MRTKAAGPEPPGHRAVPTQTCARECRSNHSARPTHYPFHGRIIAHPLHLLRDPAPLAKRARRKHVTTAGPGHMTGPSLTTTGTHSLKLYNTNQDCCPRYAHTSARSRYELTYMHTATGRDSDTRAMPWPSELEQSRASPFCSFLGSESSVYAIANWRSTSSSPGSLTPRSPTHCIFKTLHTLRAFHPFTRPAYS